jgi:23S rRNA (cytidine1920-2'-O)/16S rRNA (cytidine1409-2'-O)-methyltransferase
MRTLRRSLPKMGGSERADLFLVSHGYAKTRAEAQAAIRAGKVHANGGRINKPSQTLRPDAKIHYERAHSYVSRGALKLRAALEHFSYSAEGCTCLDIGASTGGFTQVLLEAGASRVYAIDVGHAQMNAQLASDPRVVLLEGVNARDLTGISIHEPVDVVVADVSFISLKLVLPPALSMTSKNAWAMVLVKPQFEVGRDDIGKGGIVKNPAARQAALDEMAAWFAGCGWRVDGTMASPITGSDGNQEYLLAARRK